MTIDSTMTCGGDRPQDNVQLWRYHHQSTLGGLGPSDSSGLAISLTLVFAVRRHRHKDTDLAGGGSKLEDLLLGLVTF